LGNFFAEGGWKMVAHFSWQSFDMLSATSLGIGRPAVGRRQLSTADGLPFARGWFLLPLTLSLELLVDKVEFSTT